MIGHIRLKQTGPTPGQTRRHWNRANKAAWTADAEKWIRDYHAKHFTEAGATEYGYARRSPTYTRDKQRVMGHTRPLEWSGESRRRSANGRVSATSKAGRVRMHAPALNYRNPASRANPRLELTTISQREADQIATHHARTLEKELARLATSATQDA